ncbi:MAG: hypothetical protein HYZ86_04030 [Candidatus Omnitrophica bacterium]|nr:hypothetical protein [Candidatus Omnitrophota bacterium]
MITLNYIMDPLREVGSMVLGVTPTVFWVLVVLVVGTLLARTLGAVVADVIKRIQIDKISNTIGLAGALDAGGIKRPISELIGTVISWVLTVTTFVVALKLVGIAVLGEATSSVMAYLPGLLSGIVALTVAIIIAHIIAAFIKVVAVNTDMPKPELMATFTKWAIVLTGFVAFMEKVGLGFLLTGTPFTLIIAALALALGLSFGLGGREHASRYLDKILK